jgi:hypothetical protein
MARRLESRAAAIRRARSEFDSYADTILLNEPEAGAVTGFSPHTLKHWRLTGSTKGPQPTYLLDRVRYTAGELRRWRAETQGPAGGPTPMRLTRQPQSRRHEGTRVSTHAQRLDDSGLAPAKSRPSVTKATLAGGLRRKSAPVESGTNDLKQSVCTSSLPNRQPTGPSRRGPDGKQSVEM